jgi:hypothetical protein
MCNAMINFKLTKPVLLYIELLFQLLSPSGREGGVGSQDLLYKL